MDFVTMALREKLARSGGAPEATKRKAYRLREHATRSGTFDSFQAIGTRRRRLGENGHRARMDSHDESGLG